MFVPTQINVITAEDGSKAVVIGIDLIVPLDPDGIGDLVAELLSGANEDTNQEDTPA